MKWRRGFIRLWVVVSVLWVVLVGVVEGKNVEWRLWGDWRKNDVVVTLIDGRTVQFPASMSGPEIDAALKDSNLPERRFPVITIVVTWWDYAREVSFLAQWALLPPAIVFALGVVGAWVIRGFKNTGSPT